jgi:lipopolysaccharide heptosyltransferase II
VGLISGAELSRRERWRRARRILAVRLDQLGDVIMTGPALRALKEATAGRHLTLLTSPGGGEAARLMPYVDDVLIYEAPWMKAGPAEGCPALDRWTIDVLRRRRFDAAVVFTCYSQNPLPAALMCHLADIPLRLGHCRENPYRLLTDWVEETEPEHGVRHEVQRQLDMVAAVGAHVADERLSLHVPEQAMNETRLLLAELTRGHPSQACVVHAGASAPSRRYPPDRFALAAKRLVEDLGLILLFTGVESERDLIEGIQTLMDAPSHSLIGKLDLASLAALLAQVPLVLSNNTGTVHVAAAVGTPVVDLYALTNPQHTPWRVASRVLSHDVPCKYCYKSVCPAGHHDCLRLVSPDEVVAAAEELLAMPAGPERQKGGQALVHARTECCIP